MAGLLASLIDFHLTGQWSVMERDKLTAIIGNYRLLLAVNMIYVIIHIIFNIFMIFLRFFPNQIVGILNFTLSIFLFFYKKCPQCPEYGIAFE
jgi:hypothetical protein